MPWCGLDLLRYIDGQGLPRVCGGKDLKNSQHYPRLFGAAVAQLYDKHRNEVQARIKARRHLAKTIHLACTPQTCNKNSSVSLMVADGDGVNKHIYIYIYARCYLRQLLENRKSPMKQLKDRLPGFQFPDSRIPGFQFPDSRLPIPGFPASNSRIPGFQFPDPYTYIYIYL